METTNKCFVLRKNNKAIRKKIENAGIHVCVCASFKNACWLDYHTMVANSVHGVGYYGGDSGTNSQEEELARFVAEAKNLIYCANVDEFISLIKDSGYVKQ